MYKKDKKKSSVWYKTDKDTYIYWYRYRYPTDMYADTEKDKSRKR